MSDPNQTPPVEAPEPGPAQDAPVEAPPERPHGDPLTSDERGSRHGGTPQEDAAGEAASADAPGAGGADAPPVDPATDAEAKAAEYLELAKRKQAEFENFRRRMNLQVAQAEDRGVARLAKELLPALDHLERALEAAEQHAGAEEWVKGIRLVQDEVHGALNRTGIQAFAPIGEPFDPNEHEAMAQQPSEEHESGHVAAVYQQGYRLNGAVLRPARVVVAQ